MDKTEEDQRSAELQRLNKKVFQERQEQKAALKQKEAEDSFYQKLSDMLVRIPPKYSVSEIVGYLKGKSSLMIFERHANLKYKYGNRHFWCRGYYVDTVGKNTAKMKEYIQNQLKEDLQYDQMSLVEYIDPFTGEPVKKYNK